LVMHGRNEKGPEYTFEYYHLLCSLLSNQSRKKQATTPINPELNHEK
jgi:hypothetical protein